MLGGGAEVHLSLHDRKTIIDWWTVYVDQVRPDSIK